MSDERCCGDHPSDWDRPAVPGTGWCAECLTRLRDETPERERSIR